VLVVLPVLGLVGIAAIAQQQATPQQGTSQEGGVDPVAEAARKAREQKKAEPKPKKVFTNDDLGSAAPTPAANAAGATASGNAETKENAEGAANGDKDAAADKSAGANKNGEDAWRKRFREARDKLAQAEQELDILQRESQKSQVQYYTDPQKALSEQYSRKEISDKDTKIDAKKQEIAQMKQHIADLEDELRKSGGDPGWAR
jgi:chromosome segregation ATPase